MADKKPSRLLKFVPLALFILFVLAGAEIYGVGAGSGHFLANLSTKWFSVLGLYLFASTSMLVLLTRMVRKPSDFTKSVKKSLAWRNRLGRRSSWLAIFIALIPAYFVFYSPLSFLFVGFFTRLLIFLFTLLLTTLFISKTQLIEWQALLISGLLIGALLVLAESFTLVSNYPFALHWSEGNRLWDYSIAFGQTRYNYSAGETIFAWIDRGRQTLWGLPFLIPGLPIWAARLWNAVLTTIPYALFGWIAFRPARKARGQWLLVGLWSLIFLNQGPIYTPLVFSAILVALSRRKPLWISLPLVFVAGYYASISRFTWIFGPGIWAAVLMLGDQMIDSGKLQARDWFRAALLGFAGILTRGWPVVIGIVQGLVSSAPVALGGDGTPGSQGVETLQGLQATATSQPYAWERLLPNDIFPPGILIGLALATLPVIFLLIYSIRNGIWKTYRWQRTVTAMGTLAFLVVGVIASAKVGGGTDLHNMDMFLITIVFLSALAWESGLYKKLASLTALNLRFALAALVLLPAFAPMIEGRPLELPDPARTEFVLGRIQDKVACARQYGEVLFMDQRQLLAFGYVGDVPLVVDYEKKYVMDQALASNQSYFDDFEKDLASGRFSLIVGEREAILYKALEEQSIGDGLIEENNAWVKWVTTPLLSHYESVANYRDVAVELFMPIERDFDCP